MNREQRDPNVVEFVAPVGGVVAGKMYAVGTGLVVVAMGGVKAIAEGDSASGILRIHAPLDAATGETWERGDDLFYEPTESVLTKTNTGTLSRVAKAMAAKGTDDATGWALFDGTNAGAANQGDITGVTASDGLTGGGTSGTVSLAVSFGTDANTVCEGNDSRLSDARTPTPHAGSHAPGANDEIAPSDIGAVSESDLAGLGGAAMVGIKSGEDLITLQEMFDVLAPLFEANGFEAEVDVTIALGAASGASAANPELIGATVKSWCPISGNDQIPVSCVVGGDGAVTCTVAGVETGEAVFRCILRVAQGD